MNSLIKKRILPATAAWTATAIVFAGLIGTTVLAADMPSQSAMQSSEGGISLQHRMASDSAMPMMAETVIVSGEVKRLLADTGQVIVQHQPIPDWNMSAMQMRFDLADGLSVADFTEGQQIRFRLQQSNMMKFTIVELLP